MIRWILFALLMTFAGGATIGCDGGDNHGTFVMIFTCDTAGWIVPCGCASNQAGGVARRATFVDQVRVESEVLLADVGGAAGGESPYEQEKFEAILRSEIAMGVVAHNLGASEAALGAERLRDIHQRTEAPFVSTNLSDNNGVSLAPPLRVVTVSGRHVAVLGILSPELAPAGVVARPPRDAILQAMRNSSEKYDLAVVLAYAGEDALREVAAQLPEVDLIIGGPTGQSMPAERRGPTMVAAVTNKGKFAARIEVTPSGLGECRFVELGEQFEDHSEQLAILKSFRTRLAEIDFPATETGLGHGNGLLAATAGSRFVGTAACRECHTEDCDSWDTTSHAHAWATLEANGSHVDPYCQQCHTVGYGEPGGFVSVTQSAGRVDVGCESCHGAGGDHVDNPRTPTPLTADQQCITCHDRENSPQFDYDDYWAQIEHGYPAEAREN